jgi:hypothetical protein
MVENISASNVPTALPLPPGSPPVDQRQLLSNWSLYLGNQLQALAKYAPSYGVAPAGVELLDWLTGQSQAHTPTVERIIRHFIKLREWPITMSPDQAFYISARLTAGAVWIESFIVLADAETPEAAEWLAQMPDFHDRSATLEWLLIVIWCDPLATMALRDASNPHIRIS